MIKHKIQIIEGRTIPAPTGRGKTTTVARWECSCGRKGIGWYINAESATTVAAEHVALYAAAAKTKQRAVEFG